MNFGFLIWATMISFASSFSSRSVVRSRVFNNFKLPTRHPDLISRKFSSSAKGEMNMKTVLVPISNGSEEIESVTIIDTLVRGGAVVTVASVTPDRSLQVTCSRGVKIVADTFIESCVDKEWDLIVCPGGMPGATNLSQSKALTDLLTKQNNDGKLFAAICAAPAVVLSQNNLINGRTATGYPAEKFVSMIPQYSTERVVVDGNMVTSQGPGTSLIFSLKLVEMLFGPEKAAVLEKEMLA